MICQRYAINQIHKRFVANPHIGTMTSKIIDVTKELCRNNDIEYDYDDNIYKEVDELSDFDLEKSYNESEYKHHFELIG